MADPILLGVLAGGAGLIAWLVRRQTKRHRQSLLTFARKRKGKLRTSDELGVVVDVRGIPVCVDLGLNGLRARAPFALRNGPAGIAKPGPFDSEYVAGIGVEDDRAQRLATRIQRSYRWTGEHRTLKPFVASCASTLATTTLTIPTITISRHEVLVEHRVLAEHGDLEALADGLSEFAAAIACWQMSRVEDAAKQLRAPIVMRLRGEHVEPECTVERVRFVFQLDEGEQPQALSVRASIRCEPRVSYEGVIGKSGLSPTLGDDVLSPRARDLLRELGSCRFELRERQEAALIWADAGSAEALEAGALFLQTLASRRDAGGAFR